MKRRQIRKSVLDEVETLAAEEEEIEVQAWSTAIEPLRAKDPKMHALFEEYIRDGDPQRVIALLRASQSGGRSGWSWSRLTTFPKISLLVGGGVSVALMAAVVYGLFLDSPARITSLTPACERSVANAVSAFKEELGLGFEITAELSRHIVRDGSANAHYRRDGRRYELTFRPVRKGGECQLLLTSNVRGGDRVRDTPSGLVKLAGCECE